MRRWQDLAILPVVLEAWITLCLVYAHVLVIGRNRVFANLQMLPDGEPAAPPAAAGEVAASCRWVRRGLAAAVRRLPWTPSCTLQALVAARMLGRRRISGVLLVGVRQDQNGAIAAHSWVRAGGVVICGGNAERAFTTLARYTLEPNG